jgi:hypothetical protein
MLVAYNRNSSYSGGRDQKDSSQKPAQAKKMNKSMVGAVTGGLA